MRVVVDLGPAHGWPTREHEAGIAKAAITSARYAGEQKDEEIKSTYRDRAKELLRELKVKYEGSRWEKPVEEAINSAGR